MLSDPNNHINPHYKAQWRPIYDLEPRRASLQRVEPNPPTSAKEAILDVLIGGDPALTDYDGAPTGVRESVAEDLARALHPHLFEAVATEAPAVSQERRTMYVVWSEPLVNYLGRQADKGHTELTLTP